MTQRERQLKRRRRKGLHGPLTLVLLLGGIAVLATLGAVGYVVAVAASAPDLDEIRPEQAGRTSVVLAADGSRLGYVQSDIIRTPVTSQEMPEVMREATVAIEDERFFEHEGVDYGAIIRAGVENISSGETLQGGSTITQQLVRALYIDDPQDTYARKIREAKLAQELEEKRSKQWILRNYLNSVPFGTVNGSTALGVEAASEVFFSKHAEDLDLHEAALLAGLPQAPSQYNPLRTEAAATARRNAVLTAMADNGYITRQKASKAMQRDLDVNSSDRYTTRREPYVFDYVQDELVEEYGVDTVRRGGLKIQTTIDPDLQDAGREAIDGNLSLIGPAGAVAAVDPDNGEIRTMATSGEYDDRNFNLATQGNRQPGSSFKTFALVAAVRQGIDPDSTTYTSQPLSLPLDSGTWEVSTYGGSYSGPTTLTQATLSSDNTVYAQLALDVGPEYIAETAELLGIESPLDGIPAETLGGLRVGVSPLEMAQAYATLASGGVRHDAHAVERVKFPDGEVEELSADEGERVLSEAEAYEVTQVLQQNVQSGTGTGAQIGCGDGVAGKTGTTDDFKDAWFVGYTPSLSTAVWIGHPDAAQSMPGVAGGTIPASIWSSFMSVANGDCGSFPAPDEAATLTAGGDAAAPEEPTTEDAAPVPEPVPETSPPPTEAPPPVYSEPVDPAAPPPLPPPPPAPPPVP